ncbi:MAG: BolA/IbaG family iron-sulfur metabolism protein [Oscillatoriales cyanobacterium SM2_1_8]|nr:BolA/IbaG family iron-sulfur metabolism protein [Oscillatoriales cyanobacterium SM2_1_8]
MTPEKIAELIRGALPQAEVMVENPYNDGQHFSAVVVAPEFAGLTMIQQQRLVNDALKPQIDSGAIHALQLKTYTPEQWQQHGN